MKPLLATIGSNRMKFPLEMKHKLVNILNRETSLTALLQKTRRGIEHSIWCWLFNQFSLSERGKKVVYTHTKIARKERSRKPLN